MRYLDRSQIERFPGNGFLALEESLKTRRNYRDYIDFPVKWGVLKQKVETSDLTTNELIDEINRLDAKKVAADAKAYTYAK
jgi:hypothetical protein